MSILGLDIGTSGTKAIVIDEKGNMRARARKAYAMSTPAPGRLEIAPGELWDSVRSIVREVSSAAADDPISVLSIATMGDSFVPVDGHGEPTANFILASDSRSTREAEILVREIGYERIFEITGMPPHPINTLTKILWLKNREQDTFSRSAKYLCAEEFVVSRLGLPATTSYSNACRTMAFDIESNQWSTEMMRVVGIDADAFPAVLPSGEVVGDIPGSVAAGLNLGKGVKVVAGGMDQACSALGARAIAEGVIEDSMGTVEALSFTVDRKILNDEFRHGLLNGHYSVNCHVLSDKYLIMALVLSAGSTLRWFSEEFGQKTPPQGQKPDWDIPLSSEPPVPTRLIFLPHLVGSGTPNMDPLARGMLVGLDLGVKKEDLLRSILQGIVHEVGLNLERLEKLGVPLHEIRCVGGGSRSDYWLQLRADMLGRTVIKMRDSEAAVLGAAIVAGKGRGIWSSLEEAMDCVVREDRVFMPQKKYQRFYELQKEIFQDTSQRTAGLFRRWQSMLDSLDGSSERNGPR